MYLNNKNTVWLKTGHRTWIAIFGVIQEGVLSHGSKWPPEATKGKETDTSSENLEGINPAKTMAMDSEMDFRFLASKTIRNTL